MAEKNSICERVVIKDADASTATMARELVIRGLSERFPVYDSSKNPDLYDILESYIKKGDIFLVGLIDNSVVCTGALVREDDGICRIVRMSVDRDYRGVGLGKMMLKALEDRSRNMGYRKILIETNSSWHSAVGLYKSWGFNIYKTDGGCTHFYKIL
jgi:Acetyltransferases